MSTENLSCPEHQAARAAHDAGKRKIKDTKPNITEAIHALVELYKEIWGLEADDINCGLCERFANDIVDILTDGTEQKLFAVWHHQMEDCDEDEAEKYGHCFVIYEGMFYDSESPEGEDDWRELQAFCWC